jgi:hypothetical protein
MGCFLAISIAAMPLVAVMGNEPQYLQALGNGSEQFFFIIDQEDAFCLFGHVLFLPVRAKCLNISENTGKVQGEIFLLIINLHEMSG